MFKKSILNIGLVALVANVQAQTCSDSIERNAPDSRYEVISSSNGREILDRQTKMIWQRCSIGQTWNGASCMGVATSYDWIESLKKAKEVGGGFRMPNIKELASLIESSCVDSSINEVFFPNTPIGMYWSGSPLIAEDLMRFGQYAHMVQFSNGMVNGAPKSTKMYVRLVR